MKRDGGEKSRWYSTKHDPARDYRDEGVMIYRLKRASLVPAEIRELSTEGCMDLA